MMSHLKRRKRSHKARRLRRSQRLHQEAMTKMMMTQTIKMLSFKPSESN